MAGGGSKSGLGTTWYAKMLPAVIRLASIRPDTGHPKRRMGCTVRWVARLAVRLCLLFI